MTIDRTNYDAKKYPVCCPWDGQRGSAWVRVFKPDFEDGLRKHTDKFSSYYQHLVPETDVGGANGPAIPGGAGLAVMGFEATRAREVRCERLYGFILGHIENIDIVDGIKEHVANVLPVAPAGGGPPALPADWLTQLWTWIDVTYGQPQQTGLTRLTQGNRWTDAKIIHVGINCDTLRKWYSHLIRMNNERMAPPRLAY